MAKRAGVLAKASRVDRVAVLTASVSVFSDMVKELKRELLKAKRPRRRKPVARGEAVWGGGRPGATRRA